MKKIMVVYGTRPEAIKLWSVIKALRERSVDVCVVSTGQHLGLLNQTLDALEMTPDVSEMVMQNDQTPSQVVQAVMPIIDREIDLYGPDVVVVQGDAQTAVAAAMSAFLKRVPVAHVEAGLRTYDMSSPFPEEMNRRLISIVARLHFAPTGRASANLVHGGVPQENVYVTGNTEIDALKYAMEECDPERTIPDTGMKVVVATVHRRENQGEGVLEICAALKSLAERNKNIQIVVPVHPNPRVGTLVRQYLDKVPRVKLLDPLDCVSMFYLLKDAYMVITDSGGLQESTAALHVPIVVARTTTERPERIESGGGILVPPKRSLIFDAADRLLNDEEWYEQCADADNPYGDGDAGEQIAEVLGADGAVANRN